MERLLSQLLTSRASSSPFFASQIILTSYKEMDAFTYFFSSTSSVEDVTTSSPPSDEESGGSGTSAYCVIA